MLDFLRRVFRAKVQKGATRPRVLRGPGELRFFVEQSRGEALRCLAERSAAPDRMALRRAKGDGTC